MYGKEGSIIGIVIVIIFLYLTWNNNYKWWMVVTLLVIGDVAGYHYGNRYYCWKEGVEDNQWLKDKGYRRMDSKCEENK
jgi:nicotinamide riboside transporter PnuC